MNKKYIAIFALIIFMFNGCNSTKINFNSSSSTQSVSSKTENVTNNGSSSVASSEFQMEKTDWDISVSSADDTPMPLESESSTIKTETVAQDIIKLEIPNELTGVWFPNETHLIIQDTKKFYLYDLQNNTTVKTQEIESYGVPMVCGDVLMVRNEAGLLDLDIHTLEIIQHLELKGKPLIGVYSPDKIYHILASGGCVDITNNETQQLKQIGEIGDFDVTWVEGFPEEDKVIYNNTNERTGKNLIGVISLSDTFAQLYQTEESVVSVANGRVIISSSYYGDKEDGDKYVYRLEAPTYELVATKIPALGRFALSINGDYIVNIADKSVDDKAIKSGFTIKIFDADNDQLVRSKFFGSETRPDQHIEVSTDGRNVAVSSYDDAKAVLIYSIA